MEILNKLAEEMEQDRLLFLKILESKLEDTCVSFDDPTVHRNLGRADILEKWASRLRVEADGDIIQKFQNDYKYASLEKKPSNFGCEDEQLSPHPGEISPPSPCFADADSIEALRVWRTGSGSIVIMTRPTACDSPYQWGIVAADTIRYICKSLVNAGLSYEDDDGNIHEVTYEHALDELLNGFESEMEDPTDEPKDWSPDA